MKRRNNKKARARDRRSDEGPSATAVNPDAVVGDRLPALPTDVLRTILHSVGRPARRVCRHFRDVFGPVATGLCLEHFSDHRKLAKMATPSTPDAFAAVSTLILRPNPGISKRMRSAIATRLPAAFPGLRSLDLFHLVALSAPLAATLAPLAPTLTALTTVVSPWDPAGVPTLAATLTALRALEIDAAFRQHLRPLTALHPLAPTLRSLAWADTTEPDWDANQPASDVLVDTAPFTALTHLSLPDACLEVWDHDAVHHLATSMPRLRALDINLAPFATDDPDAPTDDAIVAAVAARTALTSLTLPLVTLPYALLAPLRLAHLRIHDCWVLSGADPEAPTCQLLEAVAQPGTLTALEVCHVPLTPRAVHTLPLLAASLRSLAWCGSAPSMLFLMPLSRLTALESLRLGLHQANDPTDTASERHVASCIASALTRLTSLSLGMEQLTLGIAPVLAACVACRSPLRHLVLPRWHPCMRAMLGPAAATLVRLTLSAHSADVLRVVESVARLHLLRHLCILVDKLEEAPFPAAPPADAAGGAGMLYPFVWPADVAEPEDDGGARGLRVRLPPGLRQLCLLRPEDAPEPGDLAPLHLKALQAAAAGQDCVVRMSHSDSMVRMSHSDKLKVTDCRSAKFDDCHGYLDGADEEFFKAWRERMGQLDG